MCKHMSREVHEMYQYYISFLLFDVFSCAIFCVCLTVFGYRRRFSSTIYLIPPCTLLCVLCGYQVERELSLVDKTVEKTSFQLQYSRSLGRDGRLPPDVEQYSGPPPPAPGHTTLSLTRAGRLASSRSSEALAVSSC